MKNKIIILILILNLIFLLTGCKKSVSPAQPVSLPDVVSEPLPEVYTYSPEDALNKVDLECGVGKCDDDKWFYGSMPVQGADYEAGQIFKKIETDKLEKPEVSEQQMNDGFVYKEEDYMIRYFGEYDSRISMIKYDLDGDGEPEIIGKCYTAAYSGSWGQNLFILKKSGDEYIDLSSYTIHPHKFQVLKRNPDKKYSCLRFKDIEKPNDDMFFCYQSKSGTYKRYVLHGNLLKELVYEK